MGDFKRSQEGDYEIITWGDTFRTTFVRNIGMLDFVRILRSQNDTKDHKPQYCVFGVDQEYYGCFKSYRNAVRRAKEILLDTKNQRTKEK